MEMQPHRHSMAPSSDKKQRRCWVLSWPCSWDTVDHPRPSRPKIAGTSARVWAFRQFPSPVVSRARTNQQAMHVSRWTSSVSPQATLCPHPTAPTRLASLARVQLYVDCDGQGFELIESYERKPMTPTLCLRAQMYIGQRQREVMMDERKRELQRMQEERLKRYGDTRGEEGSSGDEGSARRD